VKVLPCGVQHEKVGYYTCYTYGFIFLMGYKGGVAGLAYRGLEKDTTPMFIIPYYKQPVPCDGGIESVLFQSYEVAKTSMLFLGVWQKINSRR